MPVVCSSIPRRPSRWGQVSAGDHLIQIYDSEHVFLEALEWFVGSGLRAGEAVVVIATARHLHELEIRLHSSWLQVDRARWQSRYIALLANEVLDQFMIDGWPDRQLFRTVLGEILDRAKGDGRKVRAFGEMVGLLMANGQKDATIRLEQLWNEVCRERGLPLFCAYSRACFPVDSSEAMKAICNEHSWLLEEGAALAPPSPGIPPSAVTAYPASSQDKINAATDDALQARLGVVRVSASAWGILMALPGVEDDPALVVDPVH